MGNDHTAVRGQAVADDRALVALARCLLTGAFLWIVHVSLLPMTFQTTPFALAERVQVAVRQPIGSGLGDHAVVFGILGLLAGLSLKARRQSLWIVLALFALMLEIAQLGLSDRHARVGDWIVNSLAPGVGLYASRFLGSWARARIERHSRSLWFALLALGTALFISSQAAAHLGLGLTPWNPGYSLLLGDEDGGGRAWRGQVALLALYPDALQPKDIERLAESREAGIAGQEFRRGLGAVALYVLSSHSGSRIEDRAGTVAAPSLAVASGTQPAGVFDGTAALVSTGSMRSVCNALTATDSFTLEVRAVCDSIEQYGPARIVTFSRGFYERNMMLGQEGASLVFRVRCPANGANGTRYEGRWSQALEARIPVHLVVSYDRGDMRLYRDGIATGSGQSVYARRYAEQIGTGGWPILVGFMWFLPLGWAFAGAWSGSSWSLRFIVGLLLVLTPSLLATCMLASVAGRTPDSSVLAWGAMALAVGAGLGAERGDR